MNPLTLSLFLSMHSQTHFNHMPLLALVAVAEAPLGCVCVGRWCSVAGAVLHIMLLW